MRVRSSRKTTLLFVIHDRTGVCSPLELEDIQKVSFVKVFNVLGAFITLSPTSLLYSFPYRYGILFQKVRGLEGNSIM